MLAGIKLIPREELLEEYSLSADNQRKERKVKHHHNSSDEDDDLKRDERHTRKSKKKRRSRTWSCSDSDSSSERESKSYSDDEEKSSKSGKKKNAKDSRKKREKESRRHRDQSSTLNGKKGSDNENGILRKEMGLEWMLRPDSSLCNDPAPVVNDQEPQDVEERKKMNPKELNPYLQDNGCGYPNDASNTTVPNQLLSSSVVGDGGASWRLKALKRAKEQAAREGRTLREVVGERWDSLQELATSVAVHRSAPSHAHLHAIKERKRGQANLAENQEKKFNNSDYIKAVSSGHSEMKKPKQDNLQWRSKHFKRIPFEDSLVSEAISSINKFSNDGSFMDSINLQKKDADVHCNSFPDKEAKAFSSNDLGSNTRDRSEMLSAKGPVLSSNQLAAKILQLKMKGKHEEADKLSKHMNLLEENSNKAIRQEAGCSSSRCIEKHISSEKKKHEDDADKHLAQRVMQNKSYSMSQSADDEYEFYEEAPGRKRKKNDVPRENKTNLGRRILTQKERCQFCFENPSRPKHLVVSIGNATYMMLPPWEPVVQGHCCILPLQHELSTRNVDQSVWEEIRNYKKCLLKMFSRKEMDVIFLETTIELSRQRRHCLIECIPVPSSIAKQAPLYFKKAIDEAEGEWGQHDMKKVIPTSGNLRNVIPANFSYFHVEFGLDRGFVHVIDDDNNFPSSFGVNVVRGMLRLPEETMRRHLRREAPENQKRAVVDFVRDWEPFDWTRELD